MRWVRSHSTFQKPSPHFKRALLITIAGNVILSIIKGQAAILSSSTAIFADMVNSFSDVVYSSFLVVGLWLAQQPPDRSHPQGHGRFEPVVALIVTMTMSYAAYEAARSAIVRFSEGSRELVIGVPLLILMISMGVKVIMYFIIRRTASQTRSPGLEAAARDNLADVFTSAAAGLGVLGATYLHPLLDPMAGLIVSAWIMRSVVDMVKENLGYLTGAGAPQELLDQFIASVKEIEGVRGVHHVITEFAGPKLVVDMHVNIDGNMRMADAHGICDSAVAVLENYPEVDRAYIHMEPVGHH